MENIARDCLKDERRISELVKSQRIVCRWSGFHIEVLEVICKKLDRQLRIRTIKSKEFIKKSLYQSPIYSIRDN